LRNFVARFVVRNRDPDLRPRLISPQFLKRPFGIWLIQRNVQLKLRIGQCLAALAPGVGIGAQVTLEVGVALYRQTSPHLMSSSVSSLLPLFPSLLFAARCTGSSHCSSVHNLQLLRSLHQRWHLRSLPVTVGMFVKLKPLLLVLLSGRGSVFSWLFQGRTQETEIPCTLVRWETAQRVNVRPQQ
jgi:hypothetical protein